MILLQQPVKRPFLILAVILSLNWIIFAIDDEGFLLRYKFKAGEPVYFSWANITKAEYLFLGSCKIYTKDGGVYKFMANGLNAKKLITFINNKVSDIELDT